MAQFKIGSVAYDPSIESISRKFVRRAVKCSRVNAKLLPAKYMGGSVRSSLFIGTQGKVKQNVLFVRENARSSALSMDEVTARNNFKNGIKWVNESLQDPGAITANQISFMAILGNPNLKVNGISFVGIGSVSGMLKRYAIKTLHDGNELPANHIMPTPTAA